MKLMNYRILINTTLKEHLQIALGSFKRKRKVVANTLYVSPVEEELYKEVAEQLKLTLKIDSELQPRYYALDRVES